MDAEVWSHADIRNGRMLFALLAVVTLAQQSAVAVLLGVGYPLSTPQVTSGAFAALPEGMRAALTLVLSIVLVALALTGRNWARVSLGFVAVLAAAGMGVRAGLLLWAAHADGGAPPVPVLVSLGLAVVGLVAGVLFIRLHALRAFAWRRSSARDAIPVPLDDKPTRRPVRREPTLGERVLALVKAVGNVVLVLAILAGFAMVYGLDEWLRALVAR